LAAIGNPDRIHNLWNIGSTERYIPPYAGAAVMFLQINGKFPMGKFLLT
jgi:hypothetical protein